jgi:hypothetical protein
VELGEVIKLDASRKLQASTSKRQAASDKQQAAWDKPLTTDFQKDRKQILETSNETRASSREKRGQLLVLHHKVLRS